MNKHLPVALFNLLLLIGLDGRAGQSSPLPEKNTLQQREILLNRISCKKQLDTNTLDTLIQQQRQDANPFNYIAETPNALYKLDQLLDTLVLISHKQPGLSEDIERFILGWNYCGLYEVNKEHVLFREQANADANINLDDKKNSGFARLGFTKKDRDVYIPNLLSEITIGPRAYHVFFNRIYYKQCFPHPDTLATSAEQPLSPLDAQQQTTPEVLVKTDYRAGFVCKDESRNIAAIQNPPKTKASEKLQKTTKKPEATPHKKQTVTRDIASYADKPAVTTQTSPTSYSGGSGNTGSAKNKQKSTTSKVTKRIANVTKKNSSTKNSLVSEAPLKPDQLNQTTNTISELPSKLEAKPTNADKLSIESAKQGNSSPSVEPQQKQAEANISEQAEAIVVAPVIVPDVVSDSAVIVPFLVPEQLLLEDLEKEKRDKGKKFKPQRKKKYVSGTASLVRPLNPDRNTSIGSSVSWSPAKNTFVRASGRFAIEDDFDFTYSWGFGYSDWRAGTWSLQVNNWGPLRPGDGLSYETANTSLGYKIKSDTLKKYNLASSLSLNRNHSSGTVSLSGTMQWSINSRLYIRHSISHPVNQDGDFSYALSFGHSNWRPNTFSYEYHNYGPGHPFSDDNFVDNGLVQISYGWFW